MEAIADLEEEFASWSDDRASDEGPINLCIRLWALARDLQDDGDRAGAREAALDATAVWALEPWSIDEDVLVELLLEVCGLEAHAILDSVRSSRTLPAWRMGSGPLSLAHSDESVVVRGPGRQGPPGTGSARRKA